MLLAPFRRKLLEVLFDGRPEADGELATATRALHQRIATERKLLTVPPDAGRQRDAGRRATSTPPWASSGSSGAGATTTFDFGEWKSPVASRKNPDGTTSFVTTAPGSTACSSSSARAPAPARCVFRDAQHEYVFREVPRSLGERARLESAVTAPV